MKTLLKLRDVEIEQSDRGTVSFATDDKTAAMFDLYQHITKLEETAKQQAVEIERLADICSDYETRLSHSDALRDSLKQERDKLNARNIQLAEQLSYVVSLADDYESDHGNTVFWKDDAVKTLEESAISTAAHDAEVIDSACDEVERQVSGRVITGLFREIASSHRASAEEVKS